MSEFYIENQGTNTYLVYEVSTQDDMDSMSFGMLVNNKIKGLAQAFYNQMNEVGVIKYNISSYVKLKDFLNSRANKKRILGVFRGIVSAIQTAEEYMIDPKHILLDTEYMYVNISSMEVNLICLPINNMERTACEYGTFFKQIMINTQFDQNENCNYVGQILNYINITPDLSLISFKDLLDRLDNDNAANARNYAVNPSIPAYEETPVQNTYRILEPNAVTQNAAVQPGVPNAVNVPQNVPQPVVNEPEGGAEETGSENSMSLFYLLNHYNKENAELYKKQKDAGKKKQSSGKKQGSGKKVQKAAEKSAPSFAIPGVQTPINPAAEEKNVRNTAAEPTIFERDIPQSMPQNIPQSMPQNEPWAYSNDTMATPHVYTPYPDNSFNNSGIGSEETTLIGENAPDQSCTAFLIRNKNSEQIFINSALFRIGRDASINDYVMDDNKYIGHFHCHIVNINGEFFLVDDNSKNHSYVDGVEAKPGENIRLNHGQRIRLANEDFEFRMY